MVSKETANKLIEYFLGNTFATGTGGSIVAKTISIPLRMYAGLSLTDPHVELKEPVGTGYARVMLGYDNQDQTFIMNTASNGESANKKILFFNEVKKLDNALIPTSLDGLAVVEIKADVFKNYSDLKSVTIPSGVTAVGSAFSGCGRLTVYAGATGEPAGWSGFNPDGRPVVWGCVLSSDNTYVASVVKSTNSISNPGDYTISPPYREGYRFGSWTARTGGAAYAAENIGAAPNGTYDAVWIQDAAAVKLFNNTFGLIFTPKGGNECCVSGIDNTPLGKPLYLFFAETLTGAPTAWGKINEDLDKNSPTYGEPLGIEPEINTVPIVRVNDLKVIMP